MWNFIKEDLKEFVDSVATDLKELSTSNENQEEGSSDHQSGDSYFVKIGLSSSTTTATTNNSESDGKNKKSSSASTLASKPIATKLPDLATLEGFDDLEEEAGGWDNEVDGDGDSEKNIGSGNNKIKTFKDDEKEVVKQKKEYVQMEKILNESEEKKGIGKQNEKDLEVQNSFYDDDPSTDMEVIKTADIQFLLATKEHDLALMRNELNIIKEKLRSQVNLCEQVVQENQSLKEIVRKQQDQIEVLQNLIQHEEGEKKTATKIKNIGSHANEGLLPKLVQAG